MPTFKKNQNQKYSDNDLNFALKEVKSNQINIRRASEMYKIPFTTLQRYLTKCKKQKKNSKCSQ